MHPIRDHIHCQIVGIGRGCFVGPHAPWRITGDAQLALVGLVRIHHDVVVQHGDIYFGLDFGANKKGPYGPLLPSHPCGEVVTGYLAVGIEDRAI